MSKKIGIAILTALFLFNVTGVFATDVKVGKYVAGDSRMDLDYDYWILLNSDHTAGLRSPDGSANGTWRFDGTYIYITINTGRGEFANVIGQTFTLKHLDSTGTVIYDGEDAYWLQ